MLPGGDFQANATLRYVIAYAYGLQPYQRVEGTASVLDEWFAVVAKAADDAAITREAQLRMVQQLLVDRFKLVVRFEEESQQVSILRQGSSGNLGPHLRPLKESCAVVQAPPPTDPTRARAQQPPCHVTFINGHMTALVERMADFSRAVSFMSRRPVVDETGLDGSFELEMTFNPATFSQGLPFPPVGLEDLPAFADALRQELGLKVETERRAVPVLVVEHVEAPTEN